MPQHDSFCLYESRTHLSVKMYSRHTEALDTQQNIRSLLPKATHCSLHYTSIKTPCTISYSYSLITAFTLGTSSPFSKMSGSGPIGVI